MLLFIFVVSLAAILLSIRAGNKNTTTFWVGLAAPFLAAFLYGSVFSGWWEGIGIRSPFYDRGVVIQRVLTVPGPTTAPAVAPAPPAPPAPTVAPAAPAPQEPAQPVPAASCDVVESYALTGLTALTVEGFAHVEYFVGKNHKDTILPAGTYNLPAQKFGYVWEYPASCTEAQIADEQVKPHAASSGGAFVVKPPAMFARR